MPSDPRVQISQRKLRLAGIVAGIVIVVVVVTGIVLRENDSAYGTWHFSRGKRAETVKVGGALSSNDGSAVLRWTLDGRGIAVRSEWEVADCIARGELTPLLTEWSLPNADIHAIYLERNRLSAKLRAFVDFLGEFLK